MRIFEEDFHQIINSNSLLIYGAKIIATEVIESFKVIDPSVSIVGCAVSNLDGNVNEVMGLPVKIIDDYQLDIQNTCVLIALGEKYHETVRKTLVNKGYQKIYPIDNMAKNFIFKRIMQIKLKRLLGVNRECGN